MSDVKYDQEKLQIEAQNFMDSFKEKLKSIVDETMGEAYVNIMPYCESDTWTNYREALRIELENEYKHSAFKNEWATNLRRTIFKENQEELSQLISKDLLKRIKELEDSRQEYEVFRYTPLGDTYQCLKKENAELKEKLDSLKYYPHDDL